jgi:hypothetical protein
MSKILFQTIPAELRYRFCGEFEWGAKEEGILSVAVVKMSLRLNFLKEI